MGFTYKNIIRIAGIVAILLLVPLILTIRDTGAGWNWSPADFFVMGGLLFAVGLIIDLTTRKIAHPLQRVLALVGIVLAFLALWAELAVDAVSKLVTLVLG